MNLSDICPCPKTSCDNRGDCARCTSAHMRKGNLNACAFYTILPFLEQAVAASPESPTAQSLKSMIQKRLSQYSELNKQHERSDDLQQELLQKMRDYCGHKD